ncbi:WG repeat-containing protein [Yeosuana sp. MJ-SS3]|uniref:WG repeat-containing protein n=1 Tax=Gilvirhabdus luticola TaxID=3079858 RepID=A0ABU3U5K3_9FLAO|nr:WG repeat-containing protein [Yeosuana sp. MJ-SS3]MDU8885691.1 WG repeat-containing protein [Yeosuana sp. MJ-SS3]
MKKVFFLFFIFAIIPFHGISQTLENLDYISPFHNDIAAVKKGEQWAFINTKGDIIIDFRFDLVLDNNNYPVFNADRCKIVKEKEGITYFGFIDTTGKIVIKPEFLNVTNFNNEYAIAVKLEKEELGRNDLLGKPVVSYSYIEVVINLNGETINYLTQPTHITLSDKYIRTPPVITSKFISENLVSLAGENDKWTIKRIVK